MHRCQFVIIQSSPAHTFFIQAKTQRFDQMQLTTIIGGEADNVAGVRGYLRFVKGYMEHRVKGQRQDQSEERPAL